MQQEGTRAAGGSDRAGRVTELRLDTSTGVGSRLQVMGRRDPTATGRIVVLAAMRSRVREYPAAVERCGKVSPSEFGQVGCNLMDHIGGEGAALMPFEAFPFRRAAIDVVYRAQRRPQAARKFRPVVSPSATTAGVAARHPYRPNRDDRRRSQGSRDETAVRRCTVGHELRSHDLDQMRSLFGRAAAEPGQPPAPFGDRAARFGKTETADRKCCRQVTLVAPTMPRVASSTSVNTVGAKQPTWEFSDLKARVYSGSAQCDGYPGDGEGCKSPCRRLRLPFVRPQEPLSCRRQRPRHVGTDQCAVTAAARTRDRSGDREALAGS